ncbi:MAG: tetratricopeptide repeat protein [Acidobacteriia bacterium]|nr:tetratricopeptide repeat protein [Terriglobia bacterium]
MSQALRTNRVGVFLAVLILAACSRDPATEKAAFLTSGEKYAKAGKYQEAVIEFRNAIEIDPRSAEAHYQLASAYLKLKATPQAYRELLTTVELDPQNSEAQLQLATLFISGRKYDEAQKAAEKVIAADPRNARAHMVLGEKHAAVQAWPLAIREFRTAIELDPTQVENYAGLALAYVSTSRAPEAEATLKRAIEVQPKSIDARLNLGRFYFLQHRLAQAEAAMRAASEVDPRATLPPLLLVKIFLDSGKLAEAERICVELKSRAADDPAVYGALASFYESTGQKEKAAAELRALMAARPKDASIKAHLTDVLIDLGHMVEAARLNRELLAESPRDPRALSSKGRILMVEQKYAEAKTALDQAVQSDPQSSTGHYLLGVAESSLGLSDQARASFARTLELSPGMADAAAALADLSARNGDSDEALRLSNQALQNNPDSTLAYVAAAKAWMAKGNASQAEGQLRSALDRDPVFLPALEAMLDVQASQGKAQETIRRISALVSQYPQNARLHFLLGVGYFKQHDLDRAEASVKQAIAIDRKTPDAFGLLAEISRARGSVEQAIAGYKAAIEENPKKVENHMALSGLYEKQGNWEEAKRAAERAHSLDPTSPFIANNLAYLYLEHGGDINVALSLAQQAKQKLPDSPIVCDTIGWAYYKLRSPEAAVAQLSESVRQAPGNPIYHYHLGMAYIAAGRLSNAQRSLQQALSANPDFPYAASAKTALQQIVKSTP